MRSHDDKPQRRRRSRADVRTRLRRDLGFIGAIPTGAGATLRSVVEPGQAGPARTWVIDGNALSGAMRAARTLVREAPQALEEEVGEAPRRWLEGVEAIIAALGPAAHGRGELPAPRGLAGALAGARATRTLAGLPDGGLVDAVCWLALGAPSELEASLAWISPRLGRFGPALAGDPAALDLALRLVRLARLDGERYADVLLDLLADRVLATTPLSAPLPPRAGTAPRAPERPPAFGATLVSMVEVVLGLDARRRRAAIGVLDRLAPRALAATWSSWWAEMDRLEAAAEVVEAAVRRAKLEKTPTRVDAAALGRRFAAWTEAAPAELRRLAAALDLVPEIVDDHAARLGMFFLWCVCHESAPRATGELLKRFARYRRTVADDRRALAPWLGYLRHPIVPSSTFYGRVVDHWLVDAPRASRRLDAFFTALGRCAARDEEVPWEPPGLTTMLAELTAFVDGDRAEALARSVIEAGVVARCGAHLPVPCLRAALDLAGARAGAPFEAQIERYGEIVVRLVEADAEEEARSGDDPLCLAAACRDPEVAEILRRLVTRGEVAPVLALGRRLRALEAAGLSPPSLEVPAPRRRAWLRHYPAALRPRLGALAGCDPEAESTAAQILGKAFPTPAALEAQIAALEAKVKRGDPRIARRLEALRRRRTEPTTPAQIDKLGAKLALAIDRRRVAAWTRAAEEAFARAIAEALGRAPPAWLLEAPMIDLWPHLLSLSAAFRRLAVRVVQARLGPYPWDLRHEPANRAFVDQLAARGIRPEPWLDGIGVVRYRSRRGDVFLQLERDPVEVLLMGKHFGTCLSPGAMNFFSAVVNAADVNKRVVYGRDASGAVVGRCLFALTDEGTLLAFHPYSHHEDWGFEAHLGDFCLRLAGSMRATVARRGHVPKLLGPDWYDDGPVDVTGRFAAFAHGSPLEVGLRSVPPAGLRDLVERQLAPARLDPITLPYVLRMGPLGARPELAEAILEMVASVPGVDLGTRELALERAYRAGALGAARQFAARRVLPDLPGARVRLATTLVVLTEIGEPSLALQLLARTRARGVRRWADEPDPWRIFAAARAHERLHRPRLAQSLYRLAMRRAPSDLKAACAARLPEEGTATERPPARADG